MKSKTILPAIAAVVVVSVSICLFPAKAGAQAVEEKWLINDDGAANGLDSGRAVGVGDAGYTYVIGASEETSDGWVWMQTYSGAAAGDASGDGPVNILDYLNMDQNRGRAVCP